MHLTILQTQTASGAAIEIILMLLGAGIISAVTTYLFAKSKFQGIISTLQLKLDEARKKLENKTDQYENLEKEYAQLRDRMEELKKEQKESEARLQDTKKRTQKKS